VEARKFVESAVIVEGHRDIYEALYYRGLGQSNPIRDVVARRLIDCGIDLCVYAVCGDSYSHTDNTGRFVETAYENMDLLHAELQLQLRFTRVRERSKTIKSRRSPHGTGWSDFWRLDATSKPRARPSMTLCAISNTW
jgi:hypothetical protein